MRPSTLDGLREQLSDWREQQAEGGPMAFFAQEVIDGLEGKLSLLLSLIDAFQVSPMGFTLKHPSQDSWGIILPDASQPGRYRWQGFRADGFTGHCTFDTAELCLGDMVDFGLKVPDPGALDRNASTQTWQRGMEMLAVVQACNSGLISWDESCRRREEISSRYPQAA